MAKANVRHEVKPSSKPLVWLRGEVKTPPFSVEARQEAGILLRLLQHGETLGMPHAEALTDVGRRCGALRVRDGDHNWRIMYRVDIDVVLIVDVYDKKTRKIPPGVMGRCRKRLVQYDAVLKMSKKRESGG